MPSGAVFRAIQRDYQSRILNLQRDKERRDELIEELKGVELTISNGEIAIAQHIAFAKQQGWDLMIREKVI